MNSIDSSCLYSEDELLQLSGIQHFAFCPRQWALIQLDQIWEDNYLTSEGTMLHQNVDNPFLRETNGSNIITLRGFKITSLSLGLNGIADAIEIYPFKNAPTSKKALLKSKLYDALPIEYKRGKPKANNCDRLQVTAQGMILEEMLGIKIKKGAVFYWEIRHREYFDITDELRADVRTMTSQMHSIIKNGDLPQTIKKAHCRNCSLIDQCMPSIKRQSAKKYILDSFDFISNPT